MPQKYGTLASPRQSDGQVKKDSPSPASHTPLPHRARGTTLAAQSTEHDQHVSPCSHMPLPQRIRGRVGDEVEGMAEGCALGLAVGDNVGAVVGARVVGAWVAGMTISFAVAAAGKTFIGDTNFSFVIIGLAYFCVTDASVFVAVVDVLDVASDDVNAEEVVVVVAAAVVVATTVGRKPATRATTAFICPTQLFCAFPMGPKLAVLRLEKNL
jgi:hypothetical protein